MVVELREYVDDRLYKTHIFDGETNEIYPKIYAKIRSSRYDWHRKYVFDRQEQHDDYYKWVKENETFEMFYGNGVVD